MKNKYINPIVEITEIKFETIMEQSNPVEGSELFGNDFAKDIRTIK